MAFQVSPGVNIAEVDMSTSVPALVTNIGAMAGQFEKGPVGEIVEISSEEELKSVFGSPNDANYKSWFTAANFLAYANSLKVVRVVNDGDASATNQARNAISGKVTVTSAVAGTQNFTGTADVPSTLYGSSAQTFDVAISGEVQSFDLAAGINNEFLLPRLASDGTTIVTANGSAAADDTNLRDLTAADVTISIRGASESSGGLLPSSRYSIGTSSAAAGGLAKITLADKIAHDTVTSGPWYVHAVANKGHSTMGTTYANGGFFFPLYTRETDANTADSGTYSGSGVSHGHWFNKYGSAFDASAIAGNVITLTNANHNLVNGDVVIYKETTAETLGLTADTLYYVHSVSGATIKLSSTYTYSTNTAGADITLATSGTATDHALYKVWYMPSSASAAVHENATAPTDTSILLYADENDKVVINVGLRTAFTMSAAPGAYAVNNGTVTATNSVDGAYASSDFTVSANSTALNFTTNAPLTGETVTVTVPAKRSFPLSPVVNTTGGQTLEVTVAGASQTAGINYNLLDNGSRIEFVSAPANSAAIVATIKNAAANNFSYTDASLLVKNQTHFDTSFGFGVAAANGHEFVAKTPGSHGNSMKVYLVDESSYANFETNYPNLASFLGEAPRADDKTVDGDATNPALVNGIGETLSQGIALVVTMTSEGNPESVVEVLTDMSKAGNGKSSTGADIYYVKEINTRSQYVYILNHPTGVDWGGNLITTGSNTKVSFSKLSNSGSADGVETFIRRPFDGGRVGIVPTVANYVSGYDLFADAETVDLGFILQGDIADIAPSMSTAQGAVGHLVSLAESRKDAIACISPRQVDVQADADATGTSNTITFLDGIVRSNYAFADSNYKYIIDKYNDTFRYVPFNADTAGVMVRSELERDAWFSPAGFNRGTIRGVVKTMQTQLKSHRDALYIKGINPVVNFAGQGTVLFGDKTFTTKPSAFSRINVRRLFIVLEKSIATAAKFTLFEFNDEFTRSQFTSLIEPFLRDVQGRRGIFDFRVVCDSTNNTNAVIDRNEFIGDIFIQPARSINFIQLNFVAVRTGVDFSEIVGAV